MLVIVGVIAVMAVAFYLIARFIVISASNAHEERWSILDLRRVENAMGAYRGQMGGILADLSSRGIGNLIRSRGGRGAERSADPLIWVSCDYLAILDDKGSVVFQESAHAQGAASAVEGFLARTDSVAARLRDPRSQGRLSGLLSTSKGIHLLVAGRVNSGSQVYTVVLGKAVDSEFMAYLQDVCQVRTSLVPASVDTSSAGGLHAILADISGKPAAVLSVETNGAALAVGYTFVDYLLPPFLAFGCLFVVIVLWILDLGLLGRVSRLAEDVRGLYRHNDISNRVHVSGSDEICNVSTAVNGLLDKVQSDFNEMRILQEDLQSRDRILERVAQAANLLVTTMDYDQGVEEAIGLLGETMGVDRVYVCEVLGQPDSGHYVATLAYEWNAGPGGKPCRSDGQGVSCALFAGWYEALSRSEHIAGRVSDFPEEAKPVVSAGRAVSSLILPVFVEDALLGLIGFDECHEERNWQSGEISILRGIAGSIGSAIERKRTHSRLLLYSEELDMQRKLMLTTLTSIGDAVITTDTRGLITFMNPVAQQLTGWLAEEALGKPVEAAFVLRDGLNGESLSNPVRMTLQQTDSSDIPVEKLLVAKDGRVTPVDDSGAPILDSEGNLLGAVLVFRDVSERKRADDEIRRRMRLERMISDISMHFVQLPSSGVDEGIDQSLKALGEFARVDRSFLFEFGRDIRSLSMTHEWASDGVERRAKDLQRVATGSIPWCIGKLEGHEHIYMCSNTPLPPHAEKEIDLLAAPETRALLAVPVLCEASLLGFCGFETKNDVREWPDELLGLLFVVGSVFGNALTKREASRQLEEARDQEVQIGARIQQSLLLGKIPARFRSFVASALTLPSKQIDGDFYDFTEHYNGCLDVIVGDVMGKGVPAALFAAGAKALFERTITQMVVGSGVGNLPQPQSIVSRVHEELTPELEALDSFITLSYARFDPTSSELTLVDCGNTRVFQVDAQTGIAEKLEGHNMPLGFDLSEHYFQNTYPYSQGDTFVFYSDGVTEARNSHGEMFGTERLIEAVEHTHLLEPTEISDYVRSSVVEFTGSPVFADDLTCVVVKASDSASPLTQAEIRVPSDLKQLAVIRDSVAGFARNNAGEEFSQKHLPRVQLAVSEAVANIVKQAPTEYSAQEGPAQLPHNSVCVRISYRSGDFDVSLTYNGRHGSDGQPSDPFDPAHGAVDHGFGAYLVGQCVDEVRCGVEEDGRQVILLRKKNL